MGEGGRITGLVPVGVGVRTKRVGVMVAVFVIVAIRWAVGEGVADSRNGGR